MTTTTHAPGAQFLDPAVLARISSLELRARSVVEGFIQGLHRAPNLGASTDFAEHRPYMPGDDVRRVDWRLYARTDRYYLKEFEADTNTNLVVVLDVSRSMTYGDKLSYACTLAACLAYFSSLQRDRVGLATFDDRIVEYVPPAAKHLRLVLYALAYVLFQRLRRLARNTGLARAQVEALRLCVIKIAARVKESTRRVQVQLCSSCPSQAVFRELARRLGVIAG